LTEFESFWIRSVRRELGNEGEDGGSVGRCEGGYLEFGLREVGGGLFEER